MQDMIEEFYLEAQEIFEEAEICLLNLEKGDVFEPNYNALFRAFHSLKGAAGMFGMESLQVHMHNLENLLETKKEEIDEDLLDYLLQGVDAAREITKGREVAFGAFSKDSQLKVVNLQEKKDAISKRAQEKQSKRDERGLVFVVDDEEGPLDLAVNILEDAGYRTISFLYPGQMLEALEEHHPDAIFSDFKMPNITGIELMRKAHEKHPMLPFILVSGILDKELAIDLISHGVSGIVEKPYDEVVMLRMVENAVKKYQALKLIDRSLNLFMYHYSELSKYLDNNGKKNLKEAIKGELKQIMDAKKIAFSA